MLQGTEVPLGEGLATKEGEALGLAVVPVAEGELVTTKEGEEVGTTEVWAGVGASVVGAFVGVAVIGSLGILSRSCMNRCQKTSSSTWPSALIFAPHAVPNCSARRNALVMVNFIVKSTRLSSIYSKLMDRVV